MSHHDEFNSKDEEPTFGRRQPRASDSVGRMIVEERAEWATERARLKEERDQAYRMLTGVESAINGEQPKHHSQISMAALELNERCTALKAEVETLRAAVQAEIDLCAEAFEFVGKTHECERCQRLRAALPAPPKAGEP